MGMSQPGPPSVAPTAGSHYSFKLLSTTGLRIGEALGLHSQDVMLTRDDERVGVLGQGGRRRTVLLDDRTLVRLLRHYLRERGYQHGPLFRAEHGVAVSALRYQSVHDRWVEYAARAGDRRVPARPSSRSRAGSGERRGVLGDDQEEAGAPRTWRPVNTLILSSRFVPH